MHTNWFLGVFKVKESKPAVKLRKKQYFHGINRGWKFSNKFFYFRTLTSNCELLTQHCKNVFLNFVALCHSYCHSFNNHVFQGFWNNYDGSFICYIQKNNSLPKTYILIPSHMFTILKLWNIFWQVRKKNNYLQKSHIIV